MKTPMPKQKPEERIKNFDEVNLGYNEELAIKEASRCLQCKKPLCVEGCPVNINIPKFIKQIKDKKFEDAIKTIKEQNYLPRVCGRVCPQETQCEEKCILAKKKQPVAIGYLERFAADNEKNVEISKMKRGNKKVAVVGSGPASLTCAAKLALMGYAVKIFEALHKTGGVLRYGIPEFRLPKKIVDDEIEYIEKLGVEVELDSVIGKTILFEELSEAYDAIFIGAGAGLPYFMHIEGENLNGVYSANEFLTRVNLMKANEFPKAKTPIKRARKTIVVGGGNVAIDVARVAKRLGSDVMVVYRRSFDEMPARIEEIEHAKEEGINFLVLTNPTKILGEKFVTGIECQQMMLGEVDSSERRMPVPIEDSEFILECNQVIIAIGQGINPLISRTSDLRTAMRGAIEVDENYRTSNPKIFAGGDVIGQEATIIKAMADGKKAASAIGAFLIGGLKDGNGFE